MKLGEEKLDELFTICVGPETIREKRPHTSPRESDRLTTNRRRMRQFQQTADVRFFGGVNLRRRSRCHRSWHGLLSGDPRRTLALGKRCTRKKKRRENGAELHKNLLSASESMVPDFRASDCKWLERHPIGHFTTPSCFAINRRA